MSAAEGSARHGAGRPATIIVVIGPAGSGKSTVAAALGRRLGWPIADGDDFHSTASIEKMSSGQPLDDDDRLPWLAAIGRWIDEQVAANRSAIVACSALRRTYREMLRGGRSGVWFACLEVRREELDRRVGRRRGHFMPVSLVADQLKVQEPLGADEPGVIVDAGQPPQAVVAAIISRLP
ncbi:MAG: gluconokinase [Chloroflexota bacterium]|nr:MAG: gluconokinase [Chloroflexota bacterium]